MIEHTEWVKEDYRHGMRGGVRLAVMGYSHWDDEGDRNGKTEETIAAVSEGRVSGGFFTRIRNYLGFDSHEELWSRVLFFNYIPSFVGNGQRRFAEATPSQYQAAEARFLRLIDRHQPDLLLAFSTKVHTKLPDEFRPATDKLKGNVDYGFYDRGGHTTMVVLLRHPQGAANETMVSAISDAFEKFQ